MAATIKIAILAQAAKAKAELKSLGDSAQDAGGRVKAGLGNLAGMAKAGAAGAGLAVGAALVAGIGNALEQGRLNAKLGAQLGLSKEDAAKVGKQAGQVYAAGFGTDVAQVNEAIKGVYQNIGAGNADWTKKITSQVLTVANTFDKDLGGTTAAVGQLMKTGLAKDAGEALDILTVGFQSGADKAGDLLDTFTEYGTQFRKFGLDGKTATGLLSQGLKAGARDADTVADAIKEFSIRAVDGSKTTAKGFAALGLSGKQMAADIAQGGPKATAALDVTLDRLRGIKDPVARSAAAVALFGTKAEDLGDALYALDPSEAVLQLGNVAGAAQRAGDAMGDNPAAKIEKFKRTISQGFTNAVGGTLGALESLGQKVAPFFEEIGAKIGPVFRDIGAKILPPLKELWGVIQNDLIPAFSDYYKAIIPIYVWLVEKLAPVVVPIFQGIIGAIKGALQVISGIIKVVTGLITGDWSKAWEGIKSIASGAAGIVKSIVGGAFRALGGLVKLGIDGAVAVARTLGDRIKSAVGNLGGLLAGAGRAVVDGFLSGISGAWGRVTGAVSSLVNRIPLAVRKMLGIASPSRVARKLMGYFGDGLVIGLDDQRGAVQRAADALVSIPAAQTARIDTAARVELTRAPGASAAAPAVLELRSSGARMDDLLLELLRGAVRVRGGNVQLVLGRG